MGPQEHANIIDSTVSIATAAMDFHEINGIPVAVIPAGYGMKNMEHLLDKPSRTKAVVFLHSLESFLDYYARFATENSMIYASDSQNPQRITAVFDHHTADEPAWSGHKAILECLPSEEWAIWSKKSGVPMTQEAFAEFLEDNLADIFKPTGAEMLEVATSLTMTKTVNFSSGIRMADGQTQFSYTEESKGSAKKGLLEIPTEFEVVIAPFNQGLLYTLIARLRYRIKDGALTFWYDLLRPHKVIEEAFANMVFQTQEKTGNTVLMGAPFV